MLTVTYGQLRDSNFGRAISKLANFNGYKHPKTAYNVAKINRRLLDEAKLAEELYKQLVERYADKDEAGKIKPVEGRGPDSFMIPDAASDEWTEKTKEYHAIAFEIDRPRINLDDVADAKLTPSEIMALDPVLAFLEDASAKE
jgi:hypothetical protein